MKRYFVSFALLLSLLLSAAIVFAVNTTWDVTLPDAGDSTLGENQKLEMQKAVDTEIRNRINGIATFVNYTSVD